MAIVHSPGYPQFALPKAIQSARKIFEADRRNIVDRKVAVQHMGYAGSNGAADKALATLAHYGLIEKAGKGDVRISQLTLDIIHPETPAAGKTALLDAAFSPQIFKDIRERFGDFVSAQTLESYLVRNNFQSRAVQPVIKSYLETIGFLEQLEAFESGNESDEANTESDPKKPGANTVFGGAQVGDLVQWESEGALKLEAPTRVRLVSDDGQWVAVDGSETGIPMNEVIVEERATTIVAPPVFKVSEPPAPDGKIEPGEVEWMRNLVGRETKVRLLVSGEMGTKEIGKLIKLLEAQRAVLSDDDEDD